MSFQHIFPVTDPIWECFIVIALVLFVPLLAHKFRFPQIAALILAGVLAGESVLNVFSLDSMLNFCNKIGLLFIMFFAGLEISLDEMKQTGRWGVVFGLLTFTVPFITLYLICLHLLSLTPAASLLVGCVMGAHTLISYPTISRHGLSKDKSVTISITGSLIAILAALIANAFIRSYFAQGDNTGFNVWLFIIKFAIYVFVIIFFFPRLTRQFFRRVKSSHAHFCFVFMLLALSSGLASFIGLEGILGAFLAGLVLGRYIPHSSPLMNRIDFMGNTLFIPIFLITTGMIIDVRSIIEDFTIILLFFGIFLSGVAGKWVVAWFVQRLGGFSAGQRKVLFGLSVAHAAGALAITMGAYSLGLVENNLLSAVVLTVLFSCILSNLVTERAASRLQAEGEKNTPYPTLHKPLVMLNNPERTGMLMECVMALRPPKRPTEIVGLHITINGEHEKQYMLTGQYDLQAASELAAAADIPFVAQNRVGNNIISSITHCAKEYGATELMLGLTNMPNITQSYFMNFIFPLLCNTPQQTEFIRLSVPLNTIRRIVLVLSEYPTINREITNCLNSVYRLGGVIGCQTYIYGQESTFEALEIRRTVQDKNRVSLFSLNDRYDFDWTLTTLNRDHLLVLIGPASHYEITKESLFIQLYEKIQSLTESCSLMIMFPEHTLSHNSFTPFPEHLQESGRTSRDLLKLLRM